MASQQAGASEIQLGDQEDVSAHSQTSGIAHKYLDSVARAKIASQPPGLPFRPLALSLGGLMEQGTSKVFQNEWKAAMTPGIFSKLLQRLSLCLVKARARNFEL